jgi:hypothetical protein
MFPDVRLVDFHPPLLFFVSDEAKQFYDDGHLGVGTGLRLMLNGDPVVGV